MNYDKANKLLAAALAEANRKALSSEQLACLMESELRELDSDHVNPLQATSNFFGSKQQ